MDNTPQYSPETALLLCHLAADAYAPEQSSADVGVYSAATDTHAVVSCNGYFTDVAFRGTKDLRNWLTDMDCRTAGATWRILSPRVHAGFLEAWLSVKQDLLERISIRSNLRLTGHSLGGALAMLAADDLAMEGYNVRTVYTFGQPRVGSQLWAESYDSGMRDRTFRIVHHRDVIPHVPWVLGLFRHAGHEAWYVADDPHSLMLDRSFAQYALGDAMTMLDAWLHPRDIETWLADHHVNRYLALFPKLPLETTDERADAGPPVPGESSQPSPVAGSGASLLTGASGNLNTVK